MWQRWSKRGPIAILLASMLLVALTAGAALAANITGTTAADVIGAGPYKGTSLTGADVIRSLGGDDRVDAYTGNDTIYGSEGNDNLIGAEETDNVKGENGNDIIDLAVYDTPNAVDKGYGGNGDDDFYAEDGNKDFINCGAGDDTIVTQDPDLDVVNQDCE